MPYMELNCAVDSHVKFAVSNLDSVCIALPNLRLYYIREPFFIIISICFLNNELHDFLEVQ